MSQSWNSRLSPLLPRAPERPSTAQVVGGGPSENEQELAGATEELYEILKCDGCSKMMISIILMCDNGHNICHICTKGGMIVPCPRCDKLVWKRRNYVIEALASKFLESCPNLGCPLITFPVKISAHVDSCKYKLYTCPMLRYKYDSECGWIGSLENFLQHFEARHSNYMKVSVDRLIPLRRFNVTKELKMMSLFTYKTLIFLFHLKVSPILRRISWAIQCVGPDRMSMDWCYEIEISNREEVGRKALLREKCIPLTRNAEKEMDAGHCAALHLDTITNHLNIFDELKFKFRMLEMDLLEHALGSR
ncbi:E3 ubiquitin-protein ligase siah-1-like [Arctopsyche grandis]|uniref:E3 ubiquitin-protein ligase siah-1-like n=1 Tax=Arctopsyche grandis TaxID=121162 RepID=UPI00406D85DB